MPTITKPLCDEGECFRYLQLGDPLPQLREIHQHHLENPLGILWSVDLSQFVSRKQAKAKWRRVQLDLKVLLDRYPSVKHVCIVFARPSRFPYSQIVRVPSGLAQKLHNDLERDRARYVQMLLLDITVCDDPQLLRERILEAYGMPPGSLDGLLLTWPDIEESSVHEAWGCRYL